jgi:hypothetical protein
MGHNTNCATRRGFDCNCGLSGPSLLTHGVKPLDPWEIELLTGEKQVDVIRQSLMNGLMDRENELVNEKNFVNRIIGEHISNGKPVTDDAIVRHVARVNQIHVALGEIARVRDLIGEAF